MRHESRKQQAILFSSVLGALPFWSTCVGEPFITVEPTDAAGAAPAIKAQGGSAATSTSDGVFAGGAPGRDPSAPTETCGDGTISEKEECDDANQIAGDGCDATCMIECPSNGIKNPVTHNCYVVGPPDSKGNLGTVKKKCEDLGAGFVLPTICSTEEIAFLRTSFLNLPAVYVGAVQAMNQPDTSTGWAWQDGNTCAVPWGTRNSPQPNDGCYRCTPPTELNREQCAFLVPDVNNGLTDSLCTNSFTYLCARSPLSVSKH